MPIVAPETSEQHALWFPKLSDAQIDQLASSSVPRQVNPREILFDQGTSDRGVFVVLSGSIEIIGVSNGVESVLTTLAPGNSLAR